MGDEPSRRSGDNAANAPGCRRRVGTVAERPVTEPLTAIVSDPIERHDFDAGALMVQYPPRLAPPKQTGGVRHRVRTR